MKPLSTKITPKIAISRCLIGDPVRYDGESKCQPQLIKKLEQVFTLIPICPEVEIGLSVPRPPIQIVVKGATLRAQVIEDPGKDLTAPLHKLAIEKAQLDIDGFILKARSPSCGLLTTPHLHEDGTNSYGAGIFASSFREANPEIPMVEAEALEDPLKLEQFIEMVIRFNNNKSLERDDPDHH